MVKNALMLSAPYRGPRRRGWALTYVTLAVCFGLLGTAGATSTGQSADAGSAGAPPAPAAAAPTAPPPDAVPLDPTPPPSSGDDFGASSAASGNTIVVGSPGAGSNGTASVFTVSNDGTTAPQDATLQHNGEGAPSGF